MVVCPEQAIVAGDLEDPDSELSRLVERNPVQVRKPEKGTAPKLFYIDADEAALVPSRTDANGRCLSSRGEFVAGDGTEIELPGSGASASASVMNFVSPASTASRRVYDVRARPPAWGWPVAAYTWTKSVSAGSFLAIFAIKMLARGAETAAVELVLHLTAMLFLLITAALLVVDLKQPKRFLYVLLRPQWSSWLVRGAYVLTGYGVIVTASLFLQLFGDRNAQVALLWPGSGLAILSAVYTAFLFAQAKGRDFWQNPLLCVHLLAHALLAGAAVWVVAAGTVEAGAAPQARAFMLSALVFSLMTVFGELLTTPPTDDARRAMGMIIGRPFGAWFWGAGIVVGHVAPLVLLAIGQGTTWAALLVLFGMFVIERLWVLAPQKIPLS